MLCRLRINTGGLFFNDFYDILNLEKNMGINNRNSGMTLVEILLTTLIMVFVCVAIFQFYISSFGVSEINKEETIAMKHLSNMAEAIKCTPASNITVRFPDGVQNGPVGNEYTVVVGGYVLANERIAVTYNNPASNPLEINIHLDWQDKRGINRSRGLVTKRAR
jgi:type II secretory pathway pseudopilin PulG